jgi:hypothetical protein
MGSSYVTCCFYYVKYLPAVSCGCSSTQRTGAAIHLIPPRVPVQATGMPHSHPRHSSSGRGKSGAGRKVGAGVRSSVESHNGAACTAQEPILASIRNMGMKMAQGKQQVSHHRDELNVEQHGFHCRSHSCPTSASLGGDMS